MGLDVDPFYPAPAVNMTTKTSSPEKRKWYQIQWFQPQDTPRERKLINKLDLLIVPYAFLAYWVKYMDQSNLSMPSITALSPSYTHTY